MPMVAFQRIIAAKRAAVLSDKFNQRLLRFQLMLHYRISDFSDVHEFLNLMAKRFGQLKKGGIPDVNKAAKTVLTDWTRSVKMVEILR